MSPERSFSSRTKDELCRRTPPHDCCAEAEVYGALLFSNTFSPEKIRVLTEHDKFATRLALLLKKHFGVTAEVDPQATRGKTAITLSGEEASTVYGHFGHEEGRSPALHLNYASIEEEHCREAFARGVFLAAGSMSAPEKNYHLELVTRHYNLSRETTALLLDMEFHPKMAVRKSNYIIYFKDSEEIEAFLTRIGAPSAALGVMETKVEKDVRNQANRKFNCDNANILKTVDAAQRQIAAIRRLEASGALEGLPEPLRQAARLRRENPDAALGELAGLSGMSRSGLSHRLAKLEAIAQNGETK